LIKNRRSANLLVTNDGEEVILALLEILKRAVAYIRVSTKSDEQLHSFDNQDQYWRNAILERGYDFRGVYADKGISGKHYRNRGQYNAMIKAAMDGEFDTIFVKSVSRFGRNAEEIVSVVRRLRAVGVNVIFEQENIDTITTTSELYLTIAAAIAEDAMRINGDNTRWTMRRIFESGRLFIGSGLYGYRMVNKTQLVIEETEATVVRRIFDLYLGGMGKNAVANLLNAENIPTLRGGLWNQSTIEGMLENEKYCGDCISQKSITRNGRRTINKDQDKYFMENSHPAIVSREIFDAVQGETVARRNPKKGTFKQTGDYLFSGKITCERCGKLYTHKFNSAGTKWAKGMWNCATYKRLGSKGCAPNSIFDSALETVFIDAYHQFIDSRNGFIAADINMQERARLLEDERKLKALKIKGLIPADEYAREHSAIITRIREIEATHRKRAANTLIEKAAKQIDRITPAEIELIKSITILDKTIRLVFINGFDITLTFSNGKSGNQKGWKQKKEERENEQRDVA